VNAHAAEAKGDGELINNSSILDAGTTQALEPEPWMGGEKKRGIAELTDEFSRRAELRFLEGAGQWQVSGR
jgi:hypothetical protein